MLLSIMTGLSDVLLIDGQDQSGHLLIHCFVGV